jgi:hypothetical protein
VASQVVIPTRFPAQPLPQSGFNDLAGVIGEVLELIDQFGIDMDGNFYFLS